MNNLEIKAGPGAISVKFPWRESFLIQDEALATKLVADLCIALRIAWPNGPAQVNPNA